MRFGSVPSDRQDFQRFRDFFPHYLGEHSDPFNRGLHYVGTLSALALAAAAVLSREPLLLLVVPLAGYGPAWVGHFFVEKNRPATFKYPFWSLAADFKMYSLALRGRMSDEVAKVCGAPLTKQEA